MLLRERDSQAANIRNIEQERPREPSPCRRIDAPRHLGDRVLHRLPRDERTAEGLAVADPGQCEVQATLCVGVGLHGERDIIQGAERGDDRRDLERARDPDGLTPQVRSICS